ncbi:DUF6538 domain-containing protein [Jiella sonneratiae]|uniref:DUF6538 domain-containing protein n=1 Tax=Jiella sonneratiae TaxID=2816856 RepID=UPI003CC96633
MSRSIPRVARRGDIFHYRMAVPIRLRPVLCKGEIKLSPRTSDPLLERDDFRLVHNLS